MAQSSVVSRANQALDAIVSGNNPNTVGTGQKRKRATEQKFYAVKEGKVPGIYETWNECLSQVRGHKGALCKCGTSVLSRMVCSRRL